MDLLIDDVRSLNVDCIARNYEVGRAILLTKTVDKLYVDFDLGEAKTGLDILKIAKMSDILPEIIILVTQNPVGLKQMQDFLKANGYEAKNNQVFIKKEEKIPYPICPINLYFEGDEDKCDVSKCNWDTETRSCSEHCNPEG